MIKTAEISHLLEENPTHSKNISEFQSTVGALTAKLFVLSEKLEVKFGGEFKETGIAKTGSIMRNEAGNLIESRDPVVTGPSDTTSDSDKNMQRYFEAPKLKRKR